jgi:hypothetical protein
MLLWVMLQLQSTVHGMAWLHCLREKNSFTCERLCSEWLQVYAIVRYSSKTLLGLCRRLSSVR